MKEFVPTYQRKEFTNVTDDSSQSSVLTGSFTEFISVSDDDDDLPIHRPAHTIRPPRILKYDKHGEPTLRTFQNSVDAHLPPVYV